MEESVTMSRVSSSSYARRKVIRRIPVNRISSSSSSSIQDPQEWSISFSSPIVKKSPMLMSQFHHCDIKPEDLQRSIAKKPSPQRPKSASQINYNTATTKQKLDRLNFLKSVQSQYSQLSQSRSASLLNVSRLQQQQQPKPVQHVKYDKSLNDDVIALNKKLQKLIEENKTLDLQLDYLIDDEVYFKQKDKVKILEKKLQEEKERYNMALKSLNNQEMQNSQIDNIRMNGVDMKPELLHVQKQAQLRVQEADLQLKVVERQLKEYERKENEVLKYIPQHYFRIVKDINYVDKLVHDLKIKQRNTIEKITQSMIMTQTMSSQETVIKVQDLVKSIETIKAQIAEQRKQHESEMIKLQKLKNIENNDIIKIVSDYDMLLREFNKLITADGSFNLDDL